MSLILRKINAFAKKVANLPPKPGGTMPVTDLQAQFDAAPEELRAALNGVIDDIIADYATKAELSGIQLGQITDGTVTPAKLSFDPATQAELNTHTGATTGIHGATSAPTANTLAFRDVSGRLQVAVPSATADAATKGYVDTTAANARPYDKGMYTGDGAASRDIALPFTPSAIIIMPKSGSTANLSGGLALNGFPAGSNFNSILIGTNKVTVYYDTANAVYTNQTGTLFHYIAFR